MNPLSALLGALGFRANQNQFAFRVAAESAQDLVVKSFTGSDHGLSADYLFQVTLSAQGPVWPGEMVGKPAQLELLGTETPVVIHGLISDFTWAGNGADGPEFVASLASPLFPLKLRRNNRVFLNTTVPQIIEEVLGGAELGCDFGWEIQGDYPLREYTVQYHESDWEFISRLAAASGLFFRWEADKDKVRLLFHDGLEQLPEVPGGELLYQVQSGTSRERETIFTFNARARLLTGAAELRDYNYRTPEILLDAPASGASAVPGHGSTYRYGEHHKDLQQGQQVAKLRQQALDWQREVYLADSDCRAAIPGGRITMTGHPDAQLNREYLILQVEHLGDQSAGLSYGGRQTAMTYRNQLTLIPFGTPYTPPLPEQRRIHGVLTAKVESAGGQYAYIDEQGRYRIRLHFDDGQATPGAASHAVRLGQTYSGENYGLHFPLHPGTEVALTCVNGDLDRPILLGALPNPATLGPVTASNPSQNILRTFGGNELLLEDRKGEERIELFTREGKNLLNLDAKAGSHKVRLAAAEGTMEVQAAKSLHLESGDTHSTTSGNDHLITVENKQQLATKKAGIDLQAATDIRMKAANNVDLTAEQQDIHLKAAKNMVLQAGEGMSVEVRNQNLTLRVTGGKLSIEAAKEMNILGQGGGAITIGQSGGQVTIASGGAVTIASHTVNINGKSVNIQGSRNSQGGGGGTLPRSGDESPIESGIDWLKRALTPTARSEGNHPITMLRNDGNTPELRKKTSGEIAPVEGKNEKHIRKIFVQEVKGNPEKEAEIGTTVTYTVTAFNLSDITDEEKMRVNWTVKNGEETIAEFKEHGAILIFNLKTDLFYDSVKAYPYINSPSSSVFAETSLKNSKNNVAVFEIRKIMPLAKRKIIREFVQPLNNTMDKYNINTNLRKCHFLAQVGHESGGLNYREEISNGEQYEGRKDLGNTVVGDGKKFKGRGLIQLTGRSNYQAYGEHIHVSLVSDGNPEKIFDNVEFSSDVAGWFWDKKGLNKHADNDDLITITRKVNGGVNGLEDRREYLDRAKTVFSKKN